MSFFRRFTACPTSCVLATFVSAFCFFLLIKYDFALRFAKAPNDAGSMDNYCINWEIMDVWYSLIRYICLYVYVFAYKANTLDKKWIENKKWIKNKYILHCIKLEIKSWEKLIPAKPNLTYSYSI